MLIKIENNENIITYQLDESVMDTIDTPTIQGISTIPEKLNYCMYVNLTCISEVRVIENFNNSYSLAIAQTGDCKKMIAFGRGLQSTILAFNTKSEGEFQRIKREIDTFSQPNR